EVVENIICRTGTQLFFALEVVSELVVEPQSRRRTPEKMKIITEGTPHGHEWNHFVENQGHRNALRAQHSKKIVIGPQEHMHRIWELRAIACQYSWVYVPVRTNKR